MFALCKISISELSMYLVENLSELHCFLANVQLLALKLQKLAPRRNFSLNWEHMSLYKVLDTLNTDQGNIPDIKYNKQTMECESKKKLLKLPIPYNLQ